MPLDKLKPPGQYVFAFHLAVRAALRGIGEFWFDVVTEDTLPAAAREQRRFQAFTRSLYANPFHTTARLIPPGIVFRTRVRAIDGGGYAVTVQAWRPSPKPEDIVQNVLRKNN